LVAIGTVFPRDTVCVNKGNVGFNVTFTKPEGCLIVTILSSHSSAEQATAQLMDEAMTSVMEALTVTQDLSSSVGLESRESGDPLPSLEHQNPPRSDEKPLPPEQETHPLKSKDETRPPEPEDNETHPPESEDQDNLENAVSAETDERKKRGRRSKFK